MARTPRLRLGCTAKALWVALRMLSLRMAIVAGIAGICFWGLFQLLDNLREPGLLRTDKAVAVKGCSSTDDHKDAARLCPQYICEKALIDRKLVALDAQFSITRDEIVDAEHVVGGAVTGTGQSFECTLSGLKLLEADLIREVAVQ